MAWRTLLTIGLLGSGIAVGCTVTSDGGDDDDDAGAGGDTGDGGGSSAGGSTGTGGRSAGGSTSAGGGGAANTGGSGTGGAAPYQCNPSNPQFDECQKCIETQCCDAFKDCVADDDCNGTTAQQGELECWHQCMVDGVTDASIIDDGFVQGCLAGCANSGPGSIATQDLTSCIMGTDGSLPDAGTPCSADCYDGLDLRPVP